MKNWGKSEVRTSESIHQSEWITYFQDLLNEKNPPKPHLLRELHNLENEPFFSDIDYRITLGEIKEALNRLNKKSAPGPDRISGALLHADKKTLLPLFHIFFNKIFSHCTQPKIFTTNYLVTILKKGESWNPDNYRGIAIGSTLAKLFSLIVLTRLESYIDKNSPISPHQIGFKKGHRTSDHIFVLHTIVDKIIKGDKKKLVCRFRRFS